MTDESRSDTRRARPLPPYALPLLGLVTSLALAYGAYALAGYSWDQVVSYESPYTGLTGADFSGPRPDLERPVPGAKKRRTVLVLIDGLRDDASRKMASVEALRERGADVRLTVPQPSLSYPTWTTIVSGAPPQISGVTTNWFTGPVEVETLFDVAAGSGRSVVVSGPDDLDTMFRVSELTSATALVPWAEGDYRTSGIVDRALELDTAAGGADFIFVLLPDMDDVGHAHGGASPEYAAMAARVDADLGRLIAGLDDGQTVFVVLPDHGHIDTGGHGGWEESVIRTWAAFAGPGVEQTSTEAPLENVAPTVAVIAGMQAPLQAIGTAIDEVLADENGSARDAEFIRSAGITLSYMRSVGGDDALAGLERVGSPAELAELRAGADAVRLKAERAERLPVLLVILGVTFAALAVIGRLSWRALLAALAGVVVYAAVYNALFFGVHGLHWSLSAFNDEAMIQAFFNQRMIEASVAGLAGCGAAALTYDALRRDLKGPEAGYAAGWLGLGTATVLLAQLALALRVGVFLWQWGADVTWILPDMREAFKYDLDLIQATALGGAAIVGPLVALGVGRLLARRREASL